MVETPIVPSIGRVMWYWPKEDDLHRDNMSTLDFTVPMKADVVFVHNPHVVNLIVTDHMGYTYRRPMVQIVDEQEPGTAQWMPYQKGQAAKTEALQAELNQKAAKLHSAGRPVAAMQMQQEANELGKLQAGAPSKEDGKR